ncbi:MAG: response regulator [Deltaproteobacteria bacterium]|nr:response regulator [Deltaproteobacteria bacterium]
MRVLLVEDNDDDALLIREMLSETALEIERADTLATALERLSQGRFDAVLLDLSLPDSFGLDTINRVLSQLPGVPIVVLTGFNDEEAAVQAVERGTQDYLIKGQVDGHLLARSLRYAIQRHKAEEILKQRNRELLVLRKISETILGCLDLKMVLEQILEQAMLSGSFDLGNIRLLDSTREALEVAVARGYRDPNNLQSHRRLSRTAEAAQSTHFRGLVFEQPCMEEHVQACSGLRTMKKEGVESFVQVPVRAEGEVLGIIQLASRTPRRFNNEEVRLLETIGNQVGIAVQRAQLYEETRRQAGELEKVNKLQADFTAMIAHDLRSPLMNIIGVVETMKDGLFGPVTQEQIKWLARMQANGQCLIDLVSDFLDVSKLESGYVDVKKEWIDLCELIRKSIENFRVLAIERGISISEALDLALPVVHLDPRRMDQVLSNLISNAIKFAGEGGKTEVGAALADAGQVKVWVRDNGAGIPADEMGQLFQKYRQGGNLRCSSQKGTGLGLVICKMIVEAHGGKIWVESEPGQGSTFFFSLPITPAGATDATPA